jgi:glycosyltransferase involved in cell wall biosynthesis
MRIAIVTPWFGADLIGGAERLAWDLSHALTRAGAHVDVLTTCCRSFHDDWSANYHRAGITSIEGFNVCRFRVDPRDRVAFSRANSALLALHRHQLQRDRVPLSPVTTDAFTSEGIRSSALLGHLRDRGHDYDAILFLPYLYTTTVEGVPLVADRAFVIPCLHDEAYAYLDAIRDVFRLAQGLFFNSEGELNVAASLYGPWVYGRATVIGHAVNVAPALSGDVVIKGFAPQRARYILFLGRGDRTKNIDLALKAFAEFRSVRRASSLQLVLAGPQLLSLQKQDGVVALGAVTEEEKAALLVNARAIVQPSVNESFSRTVYEAWSVRRPVVVHADCAATAEIVRSSGGGWTARPADEWAAVFATIDESSDTDIDGIGMRGRAASLRIGTWENVAARALTTIEEHLAHPSAEALGQVASLKDWTKPRAPAPYYDDGCLNVLSLAPLDEETAEILIEICALLRTRTNGTRLFLYEENCSPSARLMLDKLTSTLGLNDTLVFLGDDPSVRFAALRDMTVACAFGMPLKQLDQLKEAMDFGIPVAGFTEAPEASEIEAWGVTCDRTNPREAAALLLLMATDSELRSKIAAENRLKQGCRNGRDSRTPSGDFV